MAVINAGRTHAIFGDGAGDQLALPGVKSWVMKPENHCSGDDHVDPDPSAGLLLTA
jgi:hypothetical protein